MSEEEIRLDQTKKIFNTIAILIEKNETCSYRYLIYDLLGFKEKDYATLLSGMTLTNKLVECETQKEVLDKIKEKTIQFKDDLKMNEKIAKEQKRSNDISIQLVGLRVNAILELLEEIE